MIIYEHLKAITNKLKGGDIAQLQQPFIWGTVQQHRTDNC